MNLMRYLNSLTRYKKGKNSFLLIFFGFLLLSCGGGGSASTPGPGDPPPPPPPTPPPTSLDLVTTGSVFIEFNFRALDDNNFDDIVRISIEYTTSVASADVEEYDFSVDSDNNDFTKDTPYNLENLVSNTPYYYRIMVYYADGETKEETGNFETNSIDDDKNGLIEIGTLRQLYNMRYNLKGTSYKTDDSNASDDSGCPTDTGCFGYELTGNLDFDKNNSGSTWSTSDNTGTIEYTLDASDSAEPYFVVDSGSSGGWIPIGKAQLPAGSTGSTCDDNGNNTCFDAVFDGKGYLIKNLAMRRDLEYLGMFGATGASADIHNLGLVANLADYTGASNNAIHIGGLVGLQGSGGSITDSYATGSVDGGVGDNDIVGGLVGLQGSGGSITDSYATGSVDGGAGGFDRVGGLVGRQDVRGSITDSYTTGSADGGDGKSDSVGGLVGFQNGGGSITANYATGSAAGGAGDDDRVGGLVGLQGSGGSITDSYATGSVDGGDGGEDKVGGLVGLQGSGGSITDSYATGSVDGGDGGEDKVGGLVGRQDVRGSITASYATGKAAGGVGGFDRVGGLVGRQGGSITASYATGSADGVDGEKDSVGGLVGFQNGGSITASYATGSADGGAGNNDRVGGLVGLQGSGGSITASYATGSADGGAGNNDRVGGLVGLQESGGSITASYSFGESTNQEISGEEGASKPSGVFGSNDLTLENAGDYWNSTTDNTFRAWSFGTNQPPILKYADYDGTTAGKQFACLGAANTTTDADTIYLTVCGAFLPGQERESVGVDISSSGAKFGFINLRGFADITRISIEYTTTNNDDYDFSVDTDNNTDFTKDTPYILPNITPRITYYYRIVLARGGEQEIFSGNFRIFVADVDNNGLIDIDSLTQLHNMRYNLKGTSYKTDNSNASDDSGCPTDTGCFGYELTRNLDFDQDKDSITWSTSDNTGTIKYTLDQGDSAAPYFVVDSDGSGGWEPIGEAQLAGTDSTCDNSGNNTCFDAVFDGKGYLIKDLAMRRDLEYLGMFGATGASADIRNLGLVANLADYTGALNNAIYIGGLVGFQFGGSITASYATGNAAGGDGGEDRVGGLVGFQNGGSITASYATGKAAGAAGAGDRVGGLVGSQNAGGSITASYATGSAAGGAGDDDRVGGLVGSQNAGGSITASYATGKAAGAAGAGDSVGRLVGFQDTGGNIKASYSFGQIANQEKSGVSGDTKPIGVNTINDLTLSNAGGSWNSTTDNTFSAWDFGTNRQPPILKYADYDGTTAGRKFACLGAGNTATADDTIYLTSCGDFLPGQGTTIGVDISSDGAKFDFNNLRGFTDITRIRIQYTTSDNSNYEFSVDSANDFTKDTPYTLVISPSRETYYYRIVVARGEEQEIFSGDFIIFLADIDSNGLIEIDSLTQLHNMRYNLKGTSYKEGRNMSGSTIGCPTATGCFGYELTGNLDFDKNNSGSTWSTSDNTGTIEYTLDASDSAEPYFVVNSDGSGGWIPIIGDNTDSGDASFDATFDGKGYKITGLAMRRDLEYLGMFGATGASADIRNLGLVANLADYTGASSSIHIGGLVGRQDDGGITASYTTGVVDGGDGKNDSVGGLVGVSSGSIITTSYATGNAAGGAGMKDRVGGLVGQSSGSIITASYATGQAAGGVGNNDRVGGLVGEQDGGSITASYATGNAAGGAGNSDRVGGLVGLQERGSITASYATGNAAGGAGTFDYVGGLVGEQDGGSITASYATGNTDGGAGNSDRVGGLVGFQNGGNITASYATGSADGGAGNSDRVGGLVGEQGGSITASYATGNAAGGAGAGDSVGGLVGLQGRGGSITASYSFGESTNGETSGEEGTTKPIGVLGPNHLTSSNAGDSWNSTTDNTFSAWGFGTNQPPILKYADYDGTTAGRKFACLGAANITTDATTIYLPYCGDFLPGQERSLGLDISSSGAKFGFNNLRDFTDITSIRIQYTTSDNSNYEFSVDSANDFTKDTSYTLVISPSRETYYYRIVVARGEEQEIFSGDFIIFLADVDNNGLIEIDSLTQLHNMRYNLKGTSYKTGSNDIGSIIGCPTATGCFGYELTGNLDFDKNNSGSTWSTSDNTGTIEYTLDASDSAEPYFVVNSDGSGGWIPIIGDNTDSGDASFDATFDGKGYKITGLAMRRDLEYLGMFGATGASADIRNLGLVANLADYTGTSSSIHIGGLVGRQDGGGITASYATGAVDGGAEDEDRVGGLVGLQGRGGSITASYATGQAAGGAGNDDSVGGLVGEQDGGSITASYATGQAAGGAGNDDSVGGLVGEQDGGSITASYATGNAAGGAGNSDRVGGLVGLQERGSITASYATGGVAGGVGDTDLVGGLVGFQTSGSITASYATGNTDGGAGHSDRVGGLVGSQDAGGSITASYSFGNIVNEAFLGEPGTAKPMGVLGPNHLTSSNAGDYWNSTTNDTFSAWGFGTNQPPILKYADYDGTTAGRKFACLGAANTATADNTIYLTGCGDFLPGQERSLGVNISSSGAKFGFNNLRDFTDITSISIQYTTSDNSNYEFSVDSAKDFTKDTPYTLVISPSRIIYYYRIVVARGEEQEIFSGDFIIFLADVDNNGLIEIDSLTQLHNMRYNLKGTSYKTGSNDIGSTIGCPATGCFGYELTGDLDFDKNNSGSTWSTSDNTGTIEYTLDASDSVEPYFVVNSDDSGGWIPIGKAQLPAGSTDSTCDNNGNNTCFDATFDGKGYKITGLAMRRDLEYLGMFGATGASADIRNLGLVANLADYTGTSSSIHIGGLVGAQDGGSITASYAEGNAAGADGTSDIVGGLVGYQFGGSITASYATGSADGGAGDDDRVGGLVGEQDGGSITASYATGSADGGAGDDDIVGGLVGLQERGSITASYATGNADGGAGSGDYVGGLMGIKFGGSITASYSFGESTNGETSGEEGTTKPIGVLGPNHLTSSNAGDSWNSTTDNTFSAWGFGTNQPPILKYADYDGTTDGRKFACLGAANTTTADTTIYLPYCGDFLPRQERSLGLDISSSGAKFGFNNLRGFTDITRIRIEYTTIDGGNYEPSVDTDNNTDFTKDTPYTLVISPSRIIYYYRIVVARDGEQEQEIFGNFTNFMADLNSNGLIEIDSLTQLHNMRYNLKGTSYKTGRNMSGSTIGCPIDTGCFGYELTGNLDFDKNNSGSTWSTSDEGNNGTIEYTLDASDNAEPYFVVDSGGWIPIGKAQLPAGSTDSTCDNNGNNTCFDATFDGKGYKITGLAMRKDLEYLGMFGATGASADIRNLGLVANLADYTGASNNAIHIGGLVGFQFGGSITGSYATGVAAGGAGNNDRVGGLVGSQFGGSITASYATGAAAGGAGNVNRVGGLVGFQFGGSITASYATGEAAGGIGDENRVGGLVGRQEIGSITASYATGNAAGGAGYLNYVGGLVGFQFGGSITASYATGNAAGGAGFIDYVGGLVGFQFGGSITASYATGNADGGDGVGDIVGGLVGSKEEGSIITASYSFGNIANEAFLGEGGKPSGVSDPNDLTLSNAGASWDSATDNTFSAWDFTTDQPPALKYADYDGTTDGRAFACLRAASTATADSTIYLPYCGDFLPGQGRSPVGGSSATGASIALRYSALVDNDFDGYIEISNLVALGNIIYNPQGTSYKTSTASKGITSGCPRGVCRGYELTRSFSTTEFESGGVAHYLRNILTQDAVIKSNGYSISDIYFQE